MLGFTGRKTINMGVLRNYLYIETENLQWSILTVTLLWKDYCKKDMCTQKILSHSVKLWSVESGIKWALH